MPASRRAGGPAGGSGIFETARAEVRRYLRRAPVDIPGERVAPRWPRARGLMTAQTDLLGDAQRSGVRGIDVGDDLGKPERLETVAQNGRCSLGGVALAPGGAGEAPADLDLGANEIERCQQDPAEKGVSVVAAENRPITETLRIAVVDARSDEGTAAPPVGPRHVEEADHQRIVVHRDAGAEILHATRTDDQAGNGQTRLHFVARGQYPQKRKG